MANITNKITDQVKYYRSREGIMHLYSSPTFIWYFTLHISTLLMMISFNIARVGFNKEGVFGGPAHYMELFMTYGLNASSDRVSPYFSGILPWLLAPFTVAFMGLALFILADGGYANNGAKNDPLGSLYFAFFRGDVFGFEVHLFGDKMNLFYIGLIWTPIFTASIVTLLSKRRLSRDTSVVTRFIINFIISIFIGNELARMSDPNLSYSMSGFFKSLFADRKFNNFVIFDGFYHPTATAFYFTLIQLLPMIILGLMEVSLTSIRFYLLTRRTRMKIKEEHREQMDDDSDHLPWDMDQIERKKESKEKKKELKQ